MTRSRGQSSIEFIILLAAVSSFAVSVLGIYLHATHSQTSAYTELLNATATEIRNQTGYIAANGSDNVLEYIYAPEEVYVNHSSLVQVVVYASNATMDNISISADHMEAIPSKFYNTPIAQVQIFSFTVIPESVGRLNITINSAVQTESGVSHMIKNVTTYSVLQSGLALTPNGTSPPLFVPTLTENHARVLSNISPQGNITYLSEWSHCGYIGFWGHELSMQAECGGNAKWYYYMFSGPCYYDDGVVWATTCVYENTMNSTLYSIGVQNRYVYNDTLLLSNASESGTLYSSISSSENVSLLRESGNNTSAGNVTVGGQVTAYTPTQDYSYYVLRRSENFTIINSSAASQYTQLLNNLNDVLGYYNGSEIGDSELATIQQTISSYNRGAASLYNSTKADSPCAIYQYNTSTTLYSCKPFGAIDFGNLTVKISNSIPHKNASFLVSGSYIYVR